eukprot:COSAG06_NODE_7519_length_2473_cov_5.369419_2_plen_179_part_00
MQNGLYGPERHCWTDRRLVCSPAHPHTGAENASFDAICILKTTNLPRQTRDKYRKVEKRDLHFLQGTPPSLTISTALDILKAAVEATGDYASGGSSSSSSSRGSACPYENDGECDPLLWGAATAAGGGSSECPWGTDVVDCGGVNYAVWCAETAFLFHFSYEMIVLPRQARGKRRESS